MGGTVVLSNLIMTIVGGFQSVNQNMQCKNSPFIVLRKRYYRQFYANTFIYTFIAKVNDIHGSNTGRLQHGSLFNCIAYSPTNSFGGKHFYGYS